MTEMQFHKAIFLDRDGVINTDVPYVHEKDKIEFMDGIFDLCRAGKRDGYLVIIITNQAGIGHGYYTEEDFQSLMKWMLDVFKERSVIIDDIFYCPHHEEAVIPKYKKRCRSRKPAPGMIVDAAKKHNISLKNSILIGNNYSDIAAGKRAGVANLALLDKNLQESQDYRVFSDLAAIKDWYVG